MAENKKIEKALYGPSATEVALGAILGLMVGVVVACVYLVVKPVSTVKEMPKETVRGMLYYIAGSESSAKSRSWSAKQKQFLAGTSIAVVEDELNAWAIATFGAAPKAPAPGGKAGETKAPDGGIFQPGTPNFRFVGDKIQIAAKCLLNWYGVGKEVMVISTGSLVRSGDRMVFQADTLYLGSCPVHMLPAVAVPLLDHLLGKKMAPDDLRSAWLRVDGAAIEGGTLKLTVK